MKTPILIPPVKPEPVNVGELDVAEFSGRGAYVDKLGGYCGYAVKVSDGVLVYIPGGSINSMRS